MGDRCPTHNTELERMDIGAGKQAYRCRQCVDEHNRELNRVFSDPKIREALTRPLFPEREASPQKDTPNER